MKTHEFVPNVEVYLKKIDLLLEGIDKVSESERMNLINQVISLLDKNDFNINLRINESLQDQNFDCQAETE